MSHEVLIIRHSGSGVLCNSNQASQYGHSDVAATAIPEGHFVFAGDSLGHLATAGLSLSVRGPEQPPAAPSAGTKGGLYGQSAPSIDSGGAEPLSPATPTHQSVRGRVVAILGGTKPLGWPRTRPEGTCNAFYNIVRIAMFQPSWLKFTSYWRRPQPPRLRN